jgi:hypothetical protein
MKPSRGFLLLAVLAAAAGCQTHAPEEVLRPDPETLARRQLQTRRFDTTDETAILSACAGLLPDLGFNIDEAASEVGLIVASKERSAVETEAVIGAVLMSAFGGGSATWDDTQRMRASIVSRPIAGGIAVRVTFQRIVWNNHGNVSRLEGLMDPGPYQEFFSKLSKAMFLEAQQVE